MVIGPPELSSVNDQPLIVLLGPTASGKTALALALAERFNGEIVSCDSVAVYRELEIGTAKPTLAERSRVPHHCLDLFPPDQPCTAGDYARHAREALAGITARGRLPIIAGGTGLYLRALLDGLAPTPPTDQTLRARLRHRAASPSHGPAHLHRLLARLDPAAAALIHPHDTPKSIRAIEASLTARQPLTQQWQQGRAPLTGYRILRLGLAPPRPLLYERINHRAAAMFDQGLVEETALLAARYGYDCRPLGSLGYAQALALLRNEITRDQAIAQAQQGHRNYAKRQLTWFRREAQLHQVHWLAGLGADPGILDAARSLVTRHLIVSSPSPPIPAN